MHQVFSISIARYHLHAFITVFFNDSKTDSISNQQGYEKYSIVELEITYQRANIEYVASTE